MRDVVEILGIRTDLLKQSPLSFDVSQVLLALIFAAAFVEQTVLAPDAFHGGMTHRQIELANQAARSEGGQGFAQLHKLGLDGERSFVRLLMAGPGVLEQARRAVLLETAEPLADGGHGGGEEARRGFDAALLGALRQSQAMVVSVSHLTHEIEIASRGDHGGRILRAPRRPAPPPSAGR